MGFLSYLPDLKVMSNLKTELSLYTTDPDHELYLYKENNDDDLLVSSVWKRAAISYWFDTSHFLPACVTKRPSLRFSMISLSSVAKTKS